MRNAMLTGGVCGVMMVCSAGAGVLVSQPSDRPASPSFFSDAVSGQFFSQRMGDNFTLSGDSEITGIRWWGGSQNFQSPDVTNVVSWTVVLFEADGFGGVDTASAIDLGTYTLGETNAVATGSSMFGGGIEYRQEVSFEAVDLAAGDYWISIGATLESPAGDAWVWSGSTVGDLVNASDFFDGNGFRVFDPTFNDLAFEVVGVPAPAAGGLLAVAGLFARRRR